MASDTVTLALDGDPTLDDLTVALTGLRSLLRAIEAGFGTGVTISWTVDDLSVGSALGTFRGTAPNANIIPLVTNRYLEVGRAFTRRADLGSQEAARAIKQITSVLDERVPSLRFETADDDVTISQPVDATRSPGEIPPAYGGILGRIQTLTNRGALRFTLFDLLNDKAVSCYLNAGQDELIRGAWGRVALVTGWVKRDQITGWPLSIRQIESVEVQAEGEPGGWAQAVGSLRRAGAATSEPAEVVIRRIRRYVG